MSEAATRLWTPQAWVGGRWQHDVLLEVDGQGCWASVAPGVAQPPQDARRLAGPVLPGLVDAHSHAFQRAFAGLAERREGAADDFWSWRDRMYRVALQLTPAQMQAVATHLYLELLRGGYTQVCEFHYLHRASDGRAHEDPAAPCHALAQAAADAGIGLTLLPALYERAGFGQPALRADQRRFASTPDSVHALARGLRLARLPGVTAGVAVHSLRAADTAAVHELLWRVGDEDMPIHIHVAEQTQEVADCLAATGARPVAWLCREHAPDSRWQLVHATHVEPAEIASVAACGAGVVLCPGTEANLGDGCTDLPGWLGAGVPLAIGSDSHVVRNWPEELRWLEYGQRLQLRRRNVAADPPRQAASAARLWNLALSAGARAAGHPRWGLEHGARADALVLDLDDPALVGIPASHRLDALVFTGSAPRFREVLVAGRRVLQGDRHPRQEAIAQGLSEVMESLWSGV